MMYEEGECTYAVINGEMKKVGPRIKVLISSEDDLSAITTAAPGSIAYTAGEAKKWQLNPAGEWVPFANLLPTVQTEEPAPI